VKKMSMSEMEQSFSIERGPDESEVHISLAEFEQYCTLFEELIDELERNESAAYEFRGSVVATREFEMDDLEGCLDELDHAEIEEMRERYGLTSARCG